MKKNLLRNVIIGAILATTLLGGTVSASGTWTQTNGKWFLTNTDGTYSKGWQQSGNKWYYMEQDGAMKTGWKQINNTWYYLNPSGDMAIGWKLVGAKWYYLNSNGDMAFSTTVGGYVLGADGAWIPSSTTGNMGSGTNTGGTTTGGSTGNNGGQYTPTSGSSMWTPESGVVKTVAGLSSNMTKAQLNAIAVEAPASAIANGLLVPQYIPQDGKLYHYTEVRNYGGVLVSTNKYYKYLETITLSTGITRIHVLEITYSVTKITNFNVAEI